MLTECVFVAILLPLTSPCQTCGSFCQPRLTLLCSYCLPFVSPFVPSVPPVFVPALSHSFLQVFSPLSVSLVYTPSIPSTPYIFFLVCLCTAAILSSLCTTHDILVLGLNLIPDPSYLKIGSPPCRIPRY